MTARSLRTRLVQMEVLPGRPRDNTAAMLRHIAEARRDRVELLAFPEMAVPGYLLGDEWEHESFLRECEECANELRRASQGLIAIFGSIGVDWQRRNEDGRVRKYNALFLAEDGRFVGPESGPYPFAVKTLLPNYRQFDDSRHFFGLRKLALETDKRVEELIGPIRTSRLSLGCVLCEDLWDSDYAVSPLNLLRRKGADLFVSISSSPFTLNKNHKRNRVCLAQARKLQRPLLYVNNTGIQNNGKTVFTFDGASCAYDGRGNAVTAPAFEEHQLTLDLAGDLGAPFGEPVTLADDGIADVFRAIRYGTEKFMTLCGVERVVVGASGGVDSSVVAALYATLLPPERLLLVNMPGDYTSPTTRSLAAELAANLGCGYAEVPIRESVELTRGQLENLLVTSADGRVRHRLRLDGPVLENVQARDRSARILAAVAAAFRAVFTCNANKSEATVGYTTLYGDLAGYFANIADLWKTDVYALARHLNAEVFGRDVVPRGTLDIVPSAELSAAQDVDQGKGDPLVYPYHDRLFASWVEAWNRTTPEEIVDWYEKGELEQRIGYAGSVQELFASHAEFVADLERWWNQYQGLGLAKRIQAPPVLAVKRRAFGFDHREAQMGTRYTRRYAEIKQRLLGSGDRAQS